MIKSNLLYVPFVSGHNVFADCLVMRAGDLFRLIGHAQMDFTAEDAKRLAYYILESLNDFGQAARLPPAASQPEPAPMDDESGDAVVDAVRARLLERSVTGQRKYGATMMRQDLDTLGWIRHAQEEALDTAVYLERLHQDFSAMIDDGR